MMPTKLGFLFILSGYILFMTLFYSAYFHPSKSVTIYVDKFHEADTELVLFTLSIPLVFMYILYYFRSINEKNISTVNN